MSFKIADAYVEITVKDNTRADEAAIRERLNRIKGTATVDVDVDTSSLRRAEADVASFGNSMSTHGNRALGIFAAITAAAPVAAAAVAALPAALASLGGIAGVLVGSLSGISGALKAYSADQESATATSTRSAAQELSNAREIRDAQQSLAEARQRQAQVAQDSAERIADAERNQAKVAQDSADAINAARQNEAKVAQDVADSIEAARRNEAKVAEEVARSIADAERDQQKAAEDGADAIASASRRVEDALKREEDAQKALTQAREDAAKQLEDLQEKVHDYALDQEGAAIRVIEAQDKLDAVNKDAKATDLDRRKAAYDLAVAQERVRDLTREQSEATTELADAQVKGIDGSDKVVSAQKRVEDAQQGVIDAQNNLAKTQKDVADRQEEAAKRVADAVQAGQEKQQEAAERTAKAISDGAEREQEAHARTQKAIEDGAAANEEAARRVTKAQEDGARAQEDAAMAVAKASQHLADVQAQQAASAEQASKKTSQFAEAMAKLNPQQRELVEQLLRMKPLLSELSDTAGKAFLPGLTQMLRDSEGLFPIFNGWLERTGTIMGDTARKFGELFKSDEFKANLDALFRAADPITKAIGDGMVSLTDDLVTLGARAASASQGFADFFRMTMEGFSGFFRVLGDNSDTFKRLFEALGSVMRELLPVVAQIAADLAKVLAPALETLADWMGRSHDKTAGFIEVLGGLYLALKAAGVVKSVADWAGGAIEWIDKLSTRVKGLKTLLTGGLIVGGAAGALAGIGELTPGEFGDKNNSVIQEGTLGAGEIGKGILSGDLGHVWDVIGKEWGESLDHLKAGDSPIQQFGQWLGDWASTLRTNVAGFFSGLGGDIGGVWEQVKTAGQDTWTIIATSLGAAWDGIKTNADTVWNGVSSFFGTTWDTIKSTFQGATDTIGQALSTAWDTITAGTNTAWTAIQTFFGTTWDAIKGVFNTALDAVKNALSAAWDTAKTNANDVWSAIQTFFGTTWDAIKGIFTSALDAVKSGLSTAWDSIKGGVDSAWNGIKGALDSAWQSIQTTVRNGINAVVGFINGLIGDVNAVLGFFNLRTIPTVPTLAGGGLVGDTGNILGLASGGTVGKGFTTKGPMAIVGEGNPNHPEYVIPTDPMYRGNALALYRSLGAQLLAGGGILGTVESWLGDGAVNLIGSAIDGLASAIPAGMFRDVASGLGHMLIAPLKDMITAAKAAADAAAAAAAVGTGAYTGGGQLEDWIQQALAITGTPQSWDGPLHVLIMRESGGNPNAINLTDSNAAAGHPSQGLMQTIPSTFSAYHQPGTSWNITDPVANIAAGINYIKARYGTIFNVQQANPNLPPKGYDAGGLLPPGMTVAMNRSGKPERVLTAQQTEQFDRLIEALSSAPRGRGPLGPVTVNVHQVPTTNAETGRYVALALRTVA